MELGLLTLTLWGWGWVYFQLHKQSKVTMEVLRGMLLKNQERVREKIIVN